MNTFQNYLAEEFAEDYQEGRLSRAQALEMIASITGSQSQAEAVLDRAPESPRYQTPSAPGTPERAQGSAPVTAVVPPGDPAVTAGAVEFPGGDGQLLGYLARPNAKGSFPVVLVCHENRGLTMHIQDVARRLAKAGYTALAVDLLSHRGGTQAFTPEQVPGELANTPPEQFVQDFLSGWRYLQGLEGVQSQRVGMVGFCFGGGVTWRVAIAMPELRAAVPFYGPLPAPEEVKSIQAAVLAVYGGLDQRINQNIPPVEEAMHRYGKTFEKVIYPGADHAFHNDTSTRYNPSAAQDAWKRTLAWFEKYLA